MDRAVCCRRLILRLARLALSWAGTRVYVAVGGTTRKKKKRAGQRRVRATTTSSVVPCIQTIPVPKYVDRQQPPPWPGSVHVDASSLRPAHRLPSPLDHVSRPFTVRPSAQSPARTRPCSARSTSSEDATASNRASVLALHKRKRRATQRCEAHHAESTQASAAAAAGRGKEVRGDPRLHPRPRLS